MVNQLVTVYIPCRNYGRYLEKCIKSVLAQTYESWELVLINEASDDETDMLCQYYAKAYPLKIKYLNNKEPQGLQRIANNLLNNSSADYLMRLDADDWLHEGALLNLIVSLNRHQNKNIAYADYYYTNESGDIIGLEQRYSIGTEDKVGHLPPHGACTLIRMRALKSAGGYSEDINAQDGWDLWYRIGGVETSVHVSLPLFYYRQHHASLSCDSERLLKARSTIFRSIASRSVGGYEMKHLLVIPVRESYPDFEGVPFQLYKGKSLLQRALEEGGLVERTTEIVVTSSSKKVLDYSEKLEGLGIVRKHLRHKRKIENDLSIGGSIKTILNEAGEFYNATHGSYPDSISFLSLHAVERRAIHIEKAIDLLKITKCDSVVSVQKEAEPMFTYGENGLQIYNPGRLNELEFEKEKLFRFNGAIITTWWEVLAAGEVFGENIAPLEMSEKDSYQLKSK